MSAWWPAFVVMLAISAALFIGALYIGRKLKPTSGNIAMLSAVAVLILYLRLFRDADILTRLIGSPNLIIWGEWLFPLAAVVGGIAWSRIPEPHWRKALAVIPLLTLAFMEAHGFLFKPSPHIDNVWRNGVCMQSTDSSCGAAAAATLLASNGISTSEPEMAEACLTRTSGTLRFGILRGLRLKTEGTALTPEVLTCDIPALCKLAEQSPVLISVCLDGKADDDPRFKEKWGWLPGVPHTVIFFGLREGDRIEIGDPATGREHWDMLALKTLWHGQGIRLVRK